MEKPLERSHRFGKMELRIMRLLWKGDRNAREITDALNREKGEAEVAHSTVQTMLRKLENKGAVGHEVRERTFVFRALVKEENALRRTTREFVQRIFSGSTSELVAHLLRNERISREELREIRRILDEKGKGGAA